MILMSDSVTDNAIPAPDEAVATAHDFGQEMDIFETHRDITADYREYIKSFVYIKDAQIRQKVDEDLIHGVILGVN